MFGLSKRKDVFKTHTQINFADMLLNFAGGKDANRLNVVRTKEVFFKLSFGNHDTLLIILHLLGHMKLNFRTFTCMALYCAGICGQYLYLNFSRDVT